MNNFFMVSLGFLILKKLISKVNIKPKKELQKKWLFEKETLIFSIFFHFLILKYFLNAIEFTIILEFFKCVFFWKIKNILFHPGGLTMNSKYFNIYIYIYIYIYVYIYIYMYCRNFVKELVILFHRTAAAPWGHVASIIKRAPLEILPLYFPLPPLLTTGPFRSSPWQQTYLVPSSTSQEPRATNARAWVKRNRTHS